MTLKELKRKLVSLLIYVIVGPLLVLYLRMVMWFSKITIDGEHHADALSDENKGHVFIFWHNQQFIMPQLRPGRNIRPLVSDSRDGDYMAWLSRRFGKTPIRGSSSRKGVQALKQMIRLVKDGAELGIATDGPRGPAFVVKPGVVQLAQSTGAPIIPIAYAASKKMEFSSWDESFTPHLFGHLVIVYGEPVYIDRSNNIEEGVALAQAGLDAVNEKARAMIV